MIPFSFFLLFCSGREKLKTLEDTAIFILVKFNHRNKIVKQLADQFLSLLTERSELYIASLMRLLQGKRARARARDAHNDRHKQPIKQTKK